MKIGVPKEVKTDEYRVGATPGNVARWRSEGHRVFVERGAGIGSGFDDASYLAAGAELLPDAAALYRNAELIVKVKEPQPGEYPLLNEKHILFCYLHLAPLKELSLALMRSGACAIAYETVSTDGELPLLKPMSEIAGKMSALVGAHHLNRYQGGEGILIGGAEGVEGANVLVLGAGNAGFHAAKAAAALEAKVHVVNRTSPKLELIRGLTPKVRTHLLGGCDLAALMQDADLVISSILVHGGAKTPKLIHRKMLRGMRKGSVFVDITIDQGGTSETSRPTTHSRPTYVEEGVIHYCVANMPGAYARTSTIALTSATAPYVSLLAGGWKRALIETPALMRGVNVFGGEMTNSAVAEAQGLRAHPLKQLLDDA